jgi:hypothetical protein
MTNTPNMEAVNNLRPLISGTCKECNPTAT